MGPAGILRVIPGPGYSGSPLPVIKGMGSECTLEFSFKPLPSGWYWEIVVLFGGRSRLQATDGESLGDFW